MSVMRPDPNMSMEPLPEQTLEQTVILQQLNKLNTAVESIGDNQNFLRVMLLGGQYRDMMHDGKLPLLEADIKLIRGEAELLKSRVVTLETDKITAIAEKRGAAKVAARIGAVSGSIVTAAGAVLVEFLRHRN